MERKDYDVLLMDLLDAPDVSDAKEQAAREQQLSEALQAELAQHRQTLRQFREHLLLQEPSPTTDQAILRAARLAHQQQDSAAPSWWQTLLRWEGFKPALTFAMLLLMVGGIFITQTLEAPNQKATSDLPNNAAFRKARSGAIPTTPKEPPRTLTPRQDALTPHALNPEPSPPARTSASPKRPSPPPVRRRIAVNDLAPARPFAQQDPASTPRTKSEPTPRARPVVQLPPPLLMQKTPRARKVRRPTARRRPAARRRFRRTTRRRHRRKRKRRKMRRRRNSQEKRTTKTNTTKHQRYNKAKGTDKKAKVASESKRKDLQHELDAPRPERHKTRRPPSPMGGRQPGHADGKPPPPENSPPQRFAPPPPALPPRLPAVGEQRKENGTTRLQGWNLSEKVRDAPKKSQTRSRRPKARPKSAAARPTGKQSGQKSIQQLLSAARRRGSPRITRAERHLKLAKFFIQRKQPKRAHAHIQLYLSLVPPSQKKAAVARAIQLYRQIGYHQQIRLLQRQQTPPPAANKPKR